MSQQNNTRQNNQQNNNNPFRPNSQNNGNNRFGSSSRLGSSNNNQANTQQNNQQQAPQNNSRLPTRPNPFNNNANQQLSWMLTPLHRTVVRFELQGLGDPFYRMLGQPINKEYSDGRAVAKALEVGGEYTEMIQSLLDTAWGSYELNGAMLVYNWNPKTWANIARPVPMPSTADWLEELTEDEGDQKPKQKTPLPPAFNVLRAMDLQLTLNVLARARSQVLLAKAPLVLSQQYLNRVLVTDDPRLVELAQATGCVEETL